MVNRITSDAWDAANVKMGGGLAYQDSKRVDKYGHSFSYQIGFLERYSEIDIITGVITGCNNGSCASPHVNAIGDSLPTDKCIMFKHAEPGGNDHFNMRWFKEWCETNRPNILKRLNNTKAFW